MAESLLSVGVDVGTTSTQMVVSRLVVENRASAFAVPELAIGEREILYKSPVFFTPLAEGTRIDARTLRHLLEEEYRKAGIRREDIDTGAVIVTGETSRKENAASVLHALSDYAGDFVVAAAGPDLESILAARGAGALELSKQTEKQVLHMDIGGGTSNLALIRDGNIIRTGCLNVGGRLVKLDPKGEVTYVSPVLHPICPVRVGQLLTRAEAKEIANLLVQGLEMAAGLRPQGPLLTALATQEAEEIFFLSEEEGADTLFSFSGGVAECIGENHPWLEFGDLGPVLGQTIRESLLCREAFCLGRETIRATVIGAGCHSVQLSGSTVFHQNIQLPIKNLPVICPQAGKSLAEEIARKRKQQDGFCVAALPGMESPSYSQVLSLAEQVAAGFAETPIFLCLEADMAKALGQALALRLDKDAPILCLDRVSLTEGSFLDVGLPVGPALPVVVKTLVLEA